MSKVLLLGGGTQGLAILRDLKKAGHFVVFLGEKYNYADSSRYLDVKIYSKYSPTQIKYLDIVKECISNYKIDVIIPMGDVTAAFLSRYKSELQEIVNYKIPDYSIFRSATDKNQLMSLCQEHGYPHPFTVHSRDILKYISEQKLQFPLLIKPNVTCGARGMTLINNYEELAIKYPQIKNEYGECHLQKYIKPYGAQVEVQLYIDDNRQLLASSVIYKYRWYPEKGGSSSCAKTIKNEKIVDILYHLLLDLNWIGFADFDTIEDPETGELLIMELNPRVPACVKCAIEGGCHWGEIIVNGYLEKPQKTYQFTEGEFLRHMGFETLWFIHSPNRFKTYPNIFKFFGRHIHYQDMSDWTDPMPFIVGTLNNIKKLLLHKEKDKINYNLYI